MPVRSFCLLMALTAGAQTVHFQSHRGGMHEAPENTMAAFEHAWAIPGAIPETDLRTTRDGVIVLIHDSTLRRTVQAPRELVLTPIAELDWAQVHQLDAGSHFDEAYAGETIPRLEQLLAAMQGRPERRAWLDIKDADLEAVRVLLERYGVTGQTLFVHGELAACADIRTRFPEAEVMTWCSGTVEEIKARYGEVRARGFQGLTILQFHLRCERVEGEYEPMLGWAFLEEAVAAAAAHGVAIQVRPFEFDARLLRRLRESGIVWFVADAPALFHEALER